MRLAARRFVPFYFDLSNRGFAADAAARKFVVKVKPDLGGRSVPTPPVLFMTPEGKVLAEVSNYATEAQVLQAMRDVLAKHPEYNAPSAAEKEIEDPVARARLLIDLLDDQGALEALARVEADEARLLRAQIHRRALKWDAMEAELKAITDDALLDDVRAERARPLWHKRDFKALADHLKGFARESNRYTEARYFEGLAHFHRGDTKVAMAIWRETIKACAQDPWIYRADWAFCNAKKPVKSGFFSTAGKRDSCLNRIGYMGRRNPDLAR